MGRDGSIESACRCGATALATSGTPIAVASCHCRSCKEAAEQFERTGSPPLFDAGGGVPYDLFRKDRAAVVRGRENLEDHRLTADSPTRRVVARCCGTPMFLDFVPGHWLSLYRSASASEPKLRAHTPRFFLKLLAAWVAMGFRRPRVAF